MSEISGNIPASMRLQHLQNEPQRLAEEAERLNDELDALVMDNYRVFVENLTCSVYLRSEDKKLSEYSASLSDHLDKLSSQCGTFREKVNQFISSHKRNRKTLKHNMQLIELLEIPQLVDACSRNGFHDEALDLAAFVNGLERKHIFASEVRHGQVMNRKGSSVVKSIVNDVHSTLADLRRQLLMRLADDSSLPKLLQTLTALRRLDGILVDRQLSAATATTTTTTTGYPQNKVDSQGDEKGGAVAAHGRVVLSGASMEDVRSRLLQRVETSLQMNFLEARSMWVSTQVHTSTNQRTQRNGGMDRTEDDEDRHGNTTLGPYGRGIELLEIYRSSWFSVVSQFTALFASTNGEHPSASLLAYWIENQLGILLSELTKLLGEIEEGPSVRSLLEQCLLFSTRMREVGCDFKEHLLPVFEMAIRKRVEDIWSKGLTNFKQMVVTERFVMQSPSSSSSSANGIDDDLLPRENRREQVIPLYMHQDDFDALDIAETPSKKERGLPPPSALMAYPPLAYLLNTILTGLNFLKDVSLLAVQEKCLTQLEIILKDTCKFLVSVSDDIRSQGKKYFSSSASLVAAAGSTHPGCMDRVYAMVISDELLVHALLCFQLIYYDEETDHHGKTSKGVSILHEHLQAIADSCKKTFVSGGLVDEAAPALPAKKEGSASGKAEIKEKEKVMSASVVSAGEAGGDLTEKQAGQSKVDSLVESEKPQKTMANEAMTI